MRSFRFVSFICLFLYLIQAEASAQGNKQNNIWYFGLKAGLDFNTNPPTPITSDLETLEGTAVISDPAGHLLFYTNGATIWDRQHNQMPNGNGLLGGSSSSQAALIIPVPESCDKYYVFTTEDHFTNGGLSYSVVDMCLHDGLGDIPANQKNILLLDFTSEKITAILHENGVDIWVITHRMNSNTFYAYLVTASGISAPVTTSIGSSYGLSAHIGPAKASHDGRKIVSAASFFNHCELFDFDRATGLLSNFINLDDVIPGTSHIYGIEFSPNDSLLYLTDFFNTSNLYQVDLANLDIVTLASAPGDYDFGMLQMGSDLKIYMARTDEAFIDVIHHPNIKGTGCNYEANAITLLPGTTSKTGLPNFAPYSFFLDSVSQVSLPADVTLCEGTSLALNITGDATCFAGLLWSDGSTGESITASEPGTYWVEVRFTCRSYRDSIDVQFQSCPLEGCITEVGPFFEIPGKVLHGYSLTARKENDGFYLGGLLNDSALLVQYDLHGKILWARTFDVIPGRADHISAVIVDSDGMLAVSGTSGEIDNTNGGPIFVFRYDPINHQVLWTKEFVTNVTRNFNWTLIEKSPGGNYLISNIPVDENVSNVNAELYELNRNTGNVMPGIFKNLDLGNSEEITSMIMHDGYLYGTGRFSLGATPPSFRQSLIKMESSGGTIVWSKVGHRPGTADARLYGIDLLIDNDHIYHCFFGDPDGTSVTNTNFYVQKTDLDGDMSWVKQYQFPGDNDWGYEMIKSGNGIVILAAQRAQPYAYFLFKIDFEGNVIWAQRFPIPNPFYTAHPLIGESQLIEVGGQLVFTGYDVSSPDDARLIVYRTDLNGIPLGLCTEYDPTTVTAGTIENPVFFDVTMIETTPDFSTQKVTMLPGEVTIPYNPNCVLSDTIFFSITDTLCSGESIAGYTESGTYEDHYVTGAGCDSVRILALTVIDTVFSTFQATICEGESYEGYTATGTYEDVYTSAAGCDSVRIIHLTVNDCGPVCDQVIGSVYGTPGGNEQGYSLVAKPGGNGFYISGRSADSTLIAEINLNGSVAWSKKFDVVPGRIDHPGTAFVDSDGNLVVGGTAGDSVLGGSLFLIKFNPALQQLLWTKEYVTTVTHERFFSAVESPLNGNYILSTNPENEDINDNEASLLEINKATGDIIPAGSRTYIYESSEVINEFLFHDGFIYGAGRYTDGELPAQMRNTLVKIDPVSLHHVWAKLGHVPAQIDARLYGIDLVIENNSIYSIYYGDPDGTSTVQTSLYMQRTSLDGELMWLKQYELPGIGDQGYEIIRSGEGLVVLAQTDMSPQAHYLFKVDFDGNLIWANRYDLPGVSSPNLYYFGRNQLVEVGSNLVFTGHGTYSGHGNEMLVIKTTLDGVLVNPCVQSASVQVNVTNINNPLFYEVQVTEDDPLHITNTHTPDLLDANLVPNEACSFIDTIYTFFEVTICAGDTVEGYTTPGTYIDAFVTSISCDSIRTLVLHVNACNSLVAYNLDACSSFMSNGSHMDYSEFVPEYPNEAPCVNLAATHVFRDPPQENKHSCTPGVNGSIAMCISSLPTCTYIAGHETSLVFEVNVVPSPDSALRISKLEFFERSPLNYVWIGGNTGPNNYPRFYGLRVLANNVEIFRQAGIGTHADWTLQSFEFPDITGFNISTPTLFRIEFLPYCPVGNGAPVAAWDIDEINLFGGCVSSGSNVTGISGKVKTLQGQPVPQVKIRKGENHFDTSDYTFTDQEGQYHFDNLKKGLKYYVEGSSDRDLLQGVSTLDLIGIQKHLLGIKPFEFLPQYIAADINHNGKVNVTDIVDLRKTLLGIYQEFPDNTSWRVGNCHRLTSDDLNDFREAEELGPVSEDHIRLDFMGIKVGDVNGDINLLGNQTIASRSFDAVELMLEKTRIENTGEWYVEVKAIHPFTTEGMQLSLDLQDLQLKEVKGNILSLSTGYYSFSFDHKLHISWNADKPLKVGRDDILFSVIVKSTEQNQQFEIALAEKGLQPESYFRNEISEVTIRDLMQETIPVLSDITVMPNPFSNETMIQFRMATAGEVKFSFHDLTGREISHAYVQYDQGIQQYKVDTRNIPVGIPVVICRVRCNGQLFTEKLVRIK